MAGMLSISCGASVKSEQGNAKSSTVRSRELALKKPKAENPVPESSKSKTGSINIATLYIHMIESRHSAPIFNLILRDLLIIQLQMQMQIQVLSDLPSSHLP